MKILIIGLGNVGQHHYNSILNSVLGEKATSITLIDPSSRYIEKELPNKVSYFKNLSSQKGNCFDVTLINTKADCRYEVLEYVCEHIFCENIYLEKILFDKMADYDRSLKFLETGTKIKMWTSVRLQPLYRLIDKNFQTAVVQINNGSLATDLIHFADHYFEESEWPYISIEGLDGISSVEASKRTGFTEISGSVKLISSLSKKVVVLKTFNEKRNICSVFQHAHHTELINQAASKFTRFNGDKKINEVDQRLMLQSEMTGGILYDELYNGKNILMNLASAVNLHKQIYFPLADFLKLP